MQKVIARLNETLEHLKEAQEWLTRAEGSMTNHMAGEAIARAATSAREALELLEDVQEKTCRKS